MCALLLDKLSLLEGRVRQLEEDRFVTLDTTGSPDSFSSRPGSRPASVSVSPSGSIDSYANLVPSAVDDGFALVSRSRSARPVSERLPVVQPDFQPDLTPVENRYALLASPCGRRAAPVPLVLCRPRTLVIGDSITRNIRLDTPADVVCLPGARALDIEANLRVLATKRSHKDEAQNIHVTYDSIVVHVGTNDVRMRQSEVTKSNIARTCDLARKMSRHPLIVSGPLPARGNDDIYSRLVSLNRWLATFCEQQGLVFLNNWPSFWGKPGMLKADGLHPSVLGALSLSRNIGRCLRQV